MLPNIPAKRLDELMRLAVDQARQSRPEDAEPRPMVGAVLADRSGEVLLCSYRGEIAPGAHAEYGLFEKARLHGIDTEGCVLFATLEPCTRRGAGKIPCAERVAAEDLAAVYIGTLDPNPNITGRGEMLLSQATHVGRFPMALARELTALNRAFFDAHKDAHVPGESAAAVISKPVLRSDRNGLLYLTLDLVSGSETETVWVRAGDLSWWREAQTTFLEASRAGRRIRVLCTRQPREGAEKLDATVEAAQAVGVDVGLTDAEPIVRGTLADAGTAKAKMVALDHGTKTLLRAPADRGVLALLGQQFEREWATAEIRPRREVRVREVSSEGLFEALRAHVPQYRGLGMRFSPLRTADVVPMTGHLEAFKLFRIARLDALRQQWPDLPVSAVIEGSPWPITPPVVEERAEGLVVMDGTHRFYSAGPTASPVYAVVVEGCTAPLPAKPLADWTSVNAWHTKLPRDRRYIDYNGANFRPIREAFERLAATRAD